jgi:hypothetical protein
MNFRNTLVAGLGVLAGFNACSGNNAPMSPAEKAAICAKCDAGRNAVRGSALNAVDKANVRPVDGDMAQDFVDTTAAIDKLFCLKRAGLPADACSPKEGR